MRAEELRLVLESLEDRLLCVDVLLRTIDDTDVAQAQRVDAVAQNVHRVGALVHNVQLGDHAQRANACRQNTAKERNGLENKRGKSVE